MAMASLSLSSLSLKPSLALISVRASPGPSRGLVRLRGTGIGMGVALVPSIECSSRPRKKATAHHVKTRPRKKQNSYDRRRKGPTKYPPLPKPPPIWGFDTSDVDGKPELKAVSKPVVVDVEAGTVVAANVENLPVSEAPNV